MGGAAGLEKFNGVTSAAGSGAAVHRGHGANLFGNEYPKKGVRALTLKKPIEQLVMREVDRLMTKTGQCRCDQCSSDAAALALKKLPNRYSSTQRGEVLLNVELQSTQLQLDIDRAVEEACATVVENPRHDLQRESEQS